MPPPPNTTSGTATVITTLPYDVTLDLSETTGDHEVWWRYTPTVTHVLGVWAQASPVGNYEPRTEVYAAPDLVNFYLELSTKKLLQAPVAAGTTYYLRVRQGGIGSWPVTPVSVILSVLAAPDQDAPVGSVMIPDDTPGFALALLSATDGAPVQFRHPFPAGEEGAVLPSGVSLWSDTAVETVWRFYDATLTHTASPALPSQGNASALTTNRADRFYIGDAGGGAIDARVTTVLASGVLGPTIWTLPDAGLSAVGVSNDDTILYHQGQATGAGAIQRWDLIGNVALTNFPAGTISGYTMGLHAVLADDTLLVGYYRASPKDSLIRRYSAAGTLLTTYTLGAVELNHLAVSVLDDPVSFWVWSYLDGASAGQSRFEHVRVSDGTILATFDVPQFNGGAYEPALSGAPLARFGHSFSCPIVILPYALTSGGGGGGTEPPHVAPSYHLDARYIRRLRRAPHVNNDNQRVFVRRFELDLERGQGLASGQGSNPIVLLRLSRDGGQTWGEGIRMHAGALGAYTQRCLARRLGQARDTVFEVTVSDPVAWSLVGAWLDVEPGLS